MLRDLLGQETGAVAIDLKDVLLVDREAVKLLALSESNGTELRNCPAYIREWVTRDRRLMRTGPKDKSKEGYGKCLIRMVTVEAVLGILPG